MNKLIPIVFLSVFLNACSFSDYAPGPLKIYRADINQGTVLSRFVVNQLKINMSKQQVKDLIGPPSIVDPFHNNQWDYVNHSIKGSGKVIYYRLILTFKDDKLTHINTDGIASLAKLTDKQKALQEARIADEQKAVEEARIAKQKALEEARIAKQKALEEERIAKQKALEEARIAKQKALEEERIAKQKALEEERIAKQKALEKERIAKQKALEEARIAKQKAELEVKKELHKP